MALREGTNGEITETFVKKILAHVSLIDQSKIREAQLELDRSTL